MLRTLLNITDVVEEKQTVSDDLKKMWLNSLDSVVETGREEAVDTEEDNEEDKESQSVDESIVDSKEKALRALMAFISGYFVRHSQKWNKCKDCHQSIVSAKLDQQHPDFALINFLTLGYLKYLSTSFLNLLQQLEEIIMSVVNEESVHSATFVNITTECLEQVDKLTLVGCNQHKVQFSTAIITRYLTVRADFLAKGFNKANCENRVETRQRRKSSKYY